MEPTEVNVNRKSREARTEGSSFPHQRWDSLDINGKSRRMATACINDVVRGHLMCCDVRKLQAEAGRTGANPVGGGESCSDLASTDVEGKLTP